MIMHLNYIRNKLPVILKRFTSLMNIRVFHYLPRKKRKRKNKNKRAGGRLVFPFKKYFHESYSK